jgi:hypothetical protein
LAHAAAGKHAAEQPVAAAKVESPHDCQLLLLLLQRAVVNSCANVNDNNCERRATTVNNSHIARLTLVAVVQAIDRREEEKRKRQSGTSAIMAVPGHTIRAYAQRYFGTVVLWSYLRIPLPYLHRTVSNEAHGITHTT